MKLVGGMLVRNEADRYLKDTLGHMLSYCDEVVVLDDASTDKTVEIAKKFTPFVFEKNKSMFHNEIVVRKELWKHILNRNPNWILILDADEIFEDEIVTRIDDMMNQSIYDVWGFKLFDMWNETHYRDDKYWKAHNFYHPFLVRNITDYKHIWNEKPHHCGRFPVSINNLPMGKSNIRLKHLGWMKEKDRIEKYNRYKKFDPDAKYGWKEQYESILDESPNLVKF
ncbi:MAG: glycosyltransferase [bacterium]